MGLSCIGPPDWSTGLYFLEGKQSWGRRICDVSFSSVPYGMVRMDFKTWRQTSHKSRLTSSTGPGDFGDVLWGLEEFTYHLPSSRLILSNLPFVPLHSDNSHKIGLLLCLTHLIMLKVEFGEEYLTKNLSVIAHWNWNKKIYKMGWLVGIFSGLERHGG